MSTWPKISKLNEFISKFRQSKFFTINAKILEDLRKKQEQPKEIIVWG